MVTAIRIHKHVWQIERLPRRDINGVLTCPSVCRLCGASRGFRAELSDTEYHAVENARHHSVKGAMKFGDCCSTLQGMRRKPFGFTLNQ